ncbi:hypothetical protein [Timonella senegalensis]|uniref:hypothetical protein n=1 Tax=Timonella senegalensis TaxID=1465825 RepID=UPI0002EFEFB1|nr:hypothetical protein [Timonella senegalensis]
MISPSDYLYTLRNEALRVLEELSPAIEKAQNLMETLEKIADDCEDAAQLVASSDIEPNSRADTPTRSGLTRKGDPT